MFDHAPQRPSMFSFMARWKVKNESSVLIINFMFEMFINSLLEMVKSSFLPLKWQVGARKNILFGSGLYLPEKAMTVPVFDDLSSLHRLTRG